ncbi:testis-expressed protein 10 homolog isoform X3 [Pristis pectinata]|nr:testis-expressed protein 10 homolog isoform X3 [Pristis pectinata]XP_051872812.1 testis-expressed protein 10 homolog isoform X3 [Pristis pectinata]XP_051872813.1 testis-expressed protein 10 homolog isoform X3 [Pristis pectinata]XP_051872815.1 testis-expressed protein 10 homolog isoform X3 [Pristis pectinata]XP_051872816.1 testis-expressed protein 10 homolog isoform X3 [Pristis pectinata]
MTKKRKRQDDFQKVKLKVGKKKPRADNATNTTFKTRAIHVPEQLKSDVSLPTNYRKLNVKDLLTQLHHYSSGIKQSALNGLKDLVSQHPSVIASHLSNILSDLAALFTDKDSTVRSVAIQLLHFLAPKISSDQMAPFFPLVSAHLSSAMTHILEGIQEDALKILDILLEHYPELLTDCCSILLKNFLELISHQRLSKELKTGGKMNSWMLSVNPNRRITSQLWRLNVLSRLRKFLQAVVEGSNQSVESEATFESDIRTGSEHVTTLQVNWENYATGQQHIQLYEHSGSQPTTVIPFRLRPSHGAEEGLSSMENLKGFIQILVPLLLECWVEASPAQLAGPTPGSLLEPEALQLKLQVLSIIQLLWKLIKHHDETEKLEFWLRNHYLCDFKDHFIRHFPYSVLETPRHRKKDWDKKDKQGATLMNNADHSLALNLALCQVMVSLTNSLTVHQDSDWLEQIRKFVTENLSDGRKLTCQQLSGMLMLVWRLVLIQHNRASTEELLRAVYTQYQQQGLALSVRTMLINFFSGLYLREKTSSLPIARSKVLSRWLAGLPLQLAQLGSKNPLLSAQLIDVIHVAAARSNKDLLQSLQSNVYRLYDPQDGTLVLLPSETQHSLVQLVYFLPRISSELLSCLSRCCTMGRLSSKLAINLIRILHTRSSFGGWGPSLPSSLVTDVDYFSFLFSTLTGFSGEELTWLQNSSTNPHISQSQFSSIRLYVTDLDQFVHHWELTEVVCQCLSAIPSRIQCCDILQSAICKHLVGVSLLPDSTAGSILKTVGQLIDPAFIPNESLLNFLVGSCYSLLYFILTLERNNRGNAQKRELLWGSCLTALARIPRLLRLLLQSLRVNGTCQGELPVVAQILRLLLQQTQLRQHMVANAAMVQQVIQDITNFKTDDFQEQWLTDLHYCFRIYLAASFPVTY